jgi:hypothetical protein
MQSFQQEQVIEAEMAASTIARAASGDHLLDDGCHINTR